MAWCVWMRRARRLGGLAEAFGAVEESHGWIGWEEE
jgi:hypothetical protein